ncbi:MAG: putative FmdB family regulatory protein [Gammaproteobacteria bacterium]|jgi:putative FmdB family regulatory protein|tara:strand:- start:349 stop:615 length:267 start_codon:yes stop_codon:yes gene_type:complete
MPIYEYQCGSCKHIFDELQKISDDPLKDCPECKEGQLKKLVSAPKFRLKGAGWYETDFKTGSKRNIAEGSSDTKKADSSDTKKASGSE